jgi:hypothetical protein
VQTAVNGGSEPLIFVFLGGLCRPRRFLYSSAWQCGGDGIGIDLVASGSRVKSLIIKMRGERVAAKEGMNENAGVRAAAGVLIRPIFLAVSSVSRSTAAP